MTQPEILTWLVNAVLVGLGVSLFARGARIGSAKGRG